MLMLLCRPTIHKMRLSTIITFLALAIVTNLFRFCEHTLWNWISSLKSLSKSCNWIFLCRREKSAKNYLFFILLTLWMWRTYFIYRFFSLQNNGSKIRTQQLFFIERWYHQKCRLNWIPNCKHSKCKRGNSRNPWNENS